MVLKGETCQRGKVSKEQLTLLLAANMYGTKKLPILIIGKSRKPRCFARIKSLPVKYKANKKAWMFSIFFRQWFEELNLKMKKRRSKHSPLHR